MPESDPPRICPECGKPATARWPVAVSLWPKRRIIPVAITLLAAVTLGVGLWQTSETNTVTSGTPMPRLLTPLLSPGDLAGIASGEQRAEGSLADSLLDATSIPLNQPGVTAIDVGWAPAPNELHVYSRRGWPAAWWTRSERRWYEDSAAKTGFVPATIDHALKRLSLREWAPDARRVPPRDRFAWSGAKLHHRPPPEETGGAFIAESFDLFAVMWPLAAGVITWSAGSAALLIARLIRRRTEPTLARRVVRITAAAAALVMLGFLLIPSARSQAANAVQAKLVTKGIGGGGQLTWEAFSRLDITRQELADDARADNAALARMILDAAPPPTDGPPLFLAAAPVPEAVLLGATSRSFSPKLRLLRILTCQYVRHTDFGAVEPLPAPYFRIYVADYAEHHLTAQWGSGPTRSNITEISVTIETALGVIVALWLVWAVARLGATGWLAIIARRRRRAARCIACGYQSGAT